MTSNCSRSNSHAATVGAPPGPRLDSREADFSSDNTRPLAGVTAEPGCARRALLSSRTETFNGPKRISNFGLRIQTRATHRRCTASPSLRRALVGSPPCPVESARRVASSDSEWTRHPLHDVELDDSEFPPAPASVLASRRRDKVWQRRHFQLRIMRARVVTGKALHRATLRGALVVTGGAGPRFSKKATIGPVSGCVAARFAIGRGPSSPGSATTAAWTRSCSHRLPGFRPSTA